MNQKRITALIGKINTCKSQGHHLEALVASYHLNLDILWFILSKTKTEPVTEPKKIKSLIREFNAELKVNGKLKALINKKSFSMVKIWLEKMDTYYKALKSERPANSKQLLSESEKIFGLLNISANKLFVRIQR